MRKALQCKRAVPMVVMLPAVQAANLRPSDSSTGPAVGVWSVGQGISFAPGATHPHPPAGGRFSHEALLPPLGVPDLVSGSLATAWGEWRWCMAVSDRRTGGPTGQRAGAEGRSRGVGCSGQCGGNVYREGPWKSRFAKSGWPGRLGGQFNSPAGLWSESTAVSTAGLTITGSPASWLSRPSVTIGRPRQRSVTPRSFFTVPGYLVARYNY